MTSTRVLTGPAHAVKCVVMVYVALLAFIVMFLVEGVAVLAGKLVRMVRTTRGVALAGRVDVSVVPGS